MCQVRLFSGCHFLRDRAPSTQTSQRQQQTVDSGHGLWPGCLPPGNCRRQQRLSRTTKRPWLRRRCRVPPPFFPPPPLSLDPAQVPAGRVAGGGSSLMRGARRRAWSPQGLFSMQGSAEERGIQRREQSRTRHVHVDGTFTPRSRPQRGMLFCVLCSALATNRTHGSAERIMPALARLRTRRAGLPVSWIHLGIPLHGITFPFLTVTRLCALLEFNVLAGQHGLHAEAAHGIVN